MTTRPKPHVHARDHEHGGADTIRIHYESVGDPAGDAGGVDWFIAQGSATHTASPGTIELPFDSSGFYTNSSASFECDTDGRVNILQPGLYALTGILVIPSFPSDSSSGATAEILEIRGVGATGSNEYGVVDATPVSAIIDHARLPGSGGFAPAMTFPNFFNLNDDYVYSGSRPIVWPLALRFRRSWTVGDSHNEQWALVGQRYA